MHDQDRVTNDSVQSGYNEIAIKLGELRLAQRPEVERQAV
jgi:hypothetical protein